MLNIDNLKMMIANINLTGFQKEAFDFKEPDNKVSSLTGLDSVVWVRQSKKSQELIITVNLQPNSPSVAPLRALEDKGEVVPLYIEWEDIGLEVSALNCIVLETDGFGMTDEPDGFTFEIRCKNFENMKGVK